MTSVAESAHESLKSFRLFFILSGEHESLPRAEVEAILESEGLPFTPVSSSYRLLILEAQRQALKVVSDRSLMFDSCGLVLGECAAEENEIRRLVRSQPIEDLLGGLESFAVRSARMGRSETHLRRVDLEREVGAIVKEMASHSRVRLNNPDATFMCLLYGQAFSLGLSEFRKPSGLIAPRLPRKRPVFHPSTMPPKIARCMVNLARARPGGIFADPFSGVGGISLEAATIGCNVVALDADVRMTRGVRRNLRHFDREPLAVVSADARKLPLHDIDAIATDPPYGRGSSTMGLKTTHLVSKFLSDVRNALKTKSHLCISSPEETEVERYAQDAGFEVREKHLARVHRSLTRQFVVLRNC